MNHIALPSKGDIQTIFFWVGMYIISIAFAVFIGLSIFYAVKSKRIEFNKKKSAQEQTMPANQLRFAVLK